MGNGVTHCFPISEEHIPLWRRNIPVGGRAAGQCWLPSGPMDTAFVTFSIFTIWPSVCFFSLIIVMNGWHDPCIGSGCVIRPGNECGITEVVLLPVFGQAGYRCCLAGWCASGDPWGHPPVQPRPRAQRKDGVAGFAICNSA